MNFSVYNTASLNNTPESGIYSTYRSLADGTTSQYSNISALHVDDQYIYFPVMQHTYVSKNISTIGVLNTNGDLISRIEPNIPVNPKIFMADENYIYFTVEGYRIKNNADGQSRNIFRFNKNTYKVDSSFCLGSWNAISFYWMNKKNNKYYLLTTSNTSSSSNQIYPNTNENGTVGIYIIKDNQNIANLGKINTNFLNRIKIKGDDIYVAGRTSNEKATVDYPKLFKINKYNVVDLNFYPIIERLNSTSAVAAGGASSDVYDFDFDNEGIYIGGNFLTVGGEIATGLAKIDYSGNRITGFNPKITASNNLNIVRAVLTTGSGLFVAGVMGISGIATLGARVGKFNNDGTYNDNFLSTTGLMATIYASSMALSGNNLYVGAAAGTPMYSGNIPNTANIWTSGIGIIDSENGILKTGFSVRGNTATPATTDYPKLLLSGDSLYACFTAPMLPFQTLRTSPIVRHFVSGVVKMNAIDGTPDTGFKIDFSPHSSTVSVQDMIIKGNELHIVGSFTGIEGKIINSYAVVDTVSGKLLDTKSYFGANNFNRNIAYDQNKNRMIIGGGTSSPYFSGYNINYDSKINVFDNNFNILTGIQFTGIPGFFNPSPAKGSFNLLPFVNESHDRPILINDTTGYIGTGDSNNIGNTCSVRAFNMENGNLLDTSNFYLSGNNSFLSAVQYNNDYYFGGNFDRVASIGFTGLRVGVVKTNTNGVIDTSFNLNLTGTSTAVVRNLKIIDNNLYILGNSALTGVSGIRTNNFVKYNLLDQSLDTGFNYFINPFIVPIRNVHNDSQNNLYFVMTTLTDSSIEYTGRSALENSGHLFKFNSGSYVPDMDFSKKYFILTNDILIDNDKIYAPLRNMNKVSGSSVYKINKKTRQILPYTVSIPGTGTAQIAYDMYGNDTSIYLCGAITGVNGVPRTGMCKLNKSDLSLDTNFTLSLVDPVSTIFSAPPVQILEKDNYLYIMGGFTTVNQQPHTGLCRINKTNDILDTSYKIDYSGLTPNSILQAAISGKNMYFVSSLSPNFRVLDLDQGQFIFTGNSEAASSSTLYGITNTNNNLFICGFSSTTKSDGRLVGARGRGAFIAGYRSGELLPPYSVWSNSTIALYAYANYLPINNSVVMSTTSSTVVTNNVGNRSTNNLIFLDANKLYIKNKRNINYAAGLPSTVYPYFYTKNNEYYIIYSNYLFANPEDNINYITNPVYTFGIVKYDPIKERYDVIV